jgi:hypothetical protein
MVVLEVRISVSQGTPDVAVNSLPFQHLPHISEGVSDSLAVKVVPTPFNQAPADAPPSSSSRVALQARTPANTTRMRTRTIRAFFVVEFIGVVFLSKRKCGVPAEGFDAAAGTPPGEGSILL